MAGRELNMTRKSERKVSDERILQVQNLNLKNPQNTQRPILQNINFELRKGEVLGIYGLMGAGRTELCESLFGLHARLSTGAITLEGKAIHFRSPGQAIASGMALVPEDRKKNGIVPDMSVGENISLTVMGKVTKLGLLSAKLQSKLYEKYVSSLRIKVTV